MISCSANAQEKATVHKERQNLLSDFIARVEPVHDEITLHALVYVAQSLDVIENLYEFDCGSNVPLSADLSSDLYDLIQAGVLVDTRQPGTIYLRRENPAPCFGHADEESDATWEVLKELSRMDPAVTLAVFRIAQCHEGGRWPRGATEEALSELLVKTEMVYPEYARKAVKFCARRNLFGIPSDC